MKTLLLSATLAALLPSTGLAVPTVYTFTGAPYTQIEDSPEIPGTYDTSMRVTGSLTLAAPLAPNTPRRGVDPTSFAFSDGRLASAFTQDNIDPLVGITFFSLGTNAGGDVVDWDFEVARGASGLPSPATFAAVAGSTISGQYRTVGFLSIDGNRTDEGRNFFGGTWTVTPIPEPSTYALFLAGIAIVGFAAHRRHKLPSCHANARSIR